MANDTVFISIMGPDRVGFVAAVTGCLFDLGGDLCDTTFAVLGGGAEFSAICDIPDEVGPEDVEAKLRALPQLDGAQLGVTRFRLAARHDDSARANHHLSLRGGNRPGLIARLCEVFVQFQANVVRLDAERVPGDRDEYAIEIAVRIPERSAQSCLATIANTAGQLGLSFAHRGS